MNRAALVILPALLMAPQAGAQADAPVYVSERFQTAARRVADEIGFAALAEVCPDETPFCKPIVLSLVGAFRAALAKDRMGVQRALERFFLELTGNVSMHVMLGDLGRSEDPELARGARALLPCVAGIVTRSLEQCRIEAVLPDFECNGRPIDDADSALCWLEKRAIGSADKPGERGDLVVYMQQLRRLIRIGFDAGVFRSVREFLSRRELLAVEREVLDYPIAPKTRQLWSSDQWDVASCPAFETWKEKRDEIRAEYRLALIRGTGADLSALHALASKSCEGRDGTKLRRQARYQTGPISFVAFTREWSVLMLAGAAVIDLVRTGDREQLQDDLYSTIEYLAADQQAAQLRSRHLGTEADFSSIEQIRVADVERTCELIAARRLMGRSFVLSEDHTCFSMREGKERTFEPENAVATGTVAGSARSILLELGSFIELVGRERGLDSRRILGKLASAAPPARIRRILERLDRSPADAAARLELRRAALDLIRDPGDGAEKRDAKALAEKWSSSFATTHRAYLPAPSTDARATDRLDALVELARLVAGAGWRDRDPPRQLASALEAAESVLRGRAEQTVVALKRAAVEVVASDLKTRVRALIVDDDGDTCTGDSAHRWLFEGLFSDGCAAAFLVDAAIDPVVDYFSAGDRDPERLARQIHAGALRSPYLDRSPFIANVGLGFTYVALFDGGAGDFVALTLLDKFGVAFYKYLDEDFQFEWGVVVGGFIDALVRTIADEEDRFWLAGTTLGFPKLFGLPVGVEAHVGAALPFEIDGAKENIGLSAGATVVVPFSFVFDDDED